MDTPANEGNVTQPKQHPLRGRMAQMYPDRQWTNDDEYLDEADKHISSLEEYKKNSEASNKQIIDLIESEPELAAVLRDMMKGMTLREALARNVDTDSLIGMDGDPDWDAISKHKQERLSRLEENRKWQSQIEENQQKTIEAVQNFAASKELDEEKLNDFIGYVSAMLEKAFNTYLDEETLDRLYQSYSYKTDVSQAEELGYVKGKNEKISGMRKEKASSSDGLPKMLGAVTPSEEVSNKETDPLLEAMDEEIMRQKKFNS